MTALSPFANEKIERYFQLLDIDGDGRIEASDFERVTDRLMDMLGAEDFSPRAKALQAAQKEFWASLSGCADQTDLGYITPEDFKTFYARLRADIARWGGTVKGYARGHVLAILEAIDVDDSRNIDAREYDMYLQSIGVKNPDPSVFGRLDTDGDGHISFDELAQLYVTWVTSDDADEPGNLLLTGG